MSNIAKYREPGYPNKWWLTDFTMKQVEGRIDQITKLEADLTTAQSRITTLEGRREPAVGELLTAIGDMEAQYDGLAQDITTLTAENARLRGAIERLKRISPNHIRDEILKDEAVIQIGGKLDFKVHSAICLTKKKAIEIMQTALSALDATDKGDGGGGKVE